MNIRWRFNLLGTERTFYYNSKKERTVFHYGIGNRCEDGQYVLFLDYDKTPLDWITEELRLLQEWFELGTAYLFRTKNGHHVIFLEKFSLSEIVEMLGCVSIDRNYKEVPLHYARKIWVLRQTQKTGEKIEYLGCLPNPKVDPKRDRSRPHAVYLCEQAGVPTRDLDGNNSFDDKNDLIIGYYKIAKDND